MRWTREIGRRRVPQIVALYLASAWGLIEFVDWAVGRYLLSDHLVDAVLLLLLALLPAVVVLAFHHGQPGRNHWTRPVAILIGVNVMAAVGLLATQLHGKPLGRAATMVALESAAGTTDDADSAETVSRLVPGEAFRTPVLVSFWSLTNAASAEGSSADDDAWMRYGLPVLLAFDLRQDRFVRAHTPFSDALQVRLANTRLDDPFDVPLSLGRKLASAYGFTYLVGGELTREDGALVATAQVFSIKPSRLIAEETVRGADVLQLTDRLTVALKPHFDLHPASARLGDDLPIAERMSGSVAAVRGFTDSLRDRVLTPGPAAAVPGLQRALAHDKDFALAHLSLAQVMFLMGNPLASSTAAARAIELEYRLDLDDAFQARVLSAYNRQDIDEVVRIFEQWVTLYPEDTRALAGLALISLVHRNRRDEAVDLLERALKADATARFEVLPQLAKALALTGQVETATARLRALVDDEPEWREGPLLLAEVMMATPDFPGARSALERAEILSPEDIQPSILLAFIDLADGALDSAWERIEDAGRRADTSSERWMAQRYALTYYDHSGQPSRAAALVEDGSALGTGDFMGSLIGTMFELELLPTLADAGRDDLIDAIVERKTGSLPPSFHGTLDLSLLEVAIQRGDIEAIERYLPGATAFLERQQAAYASFAPIRAQARLDELSGDLASALDGYGEAYDLQTSSLASAFDPRIGAAFLKAMGRCARRQGDFDRAETLLGRALEFWPAGPKILVERAKIALDRGDRDDAREWLDRALAVWKDAEPAYRPATEARALLASLDDS